jgi:hypothetical protein
MLFPKSWITSSACVFFDFGAAEGEPDLLWCLLPYRVGRDAIVIAMPRAQFIERAKEHAEIVPARAIAESIARSRELAAMQRAQLDRQRASLFMMQQLQRQQQWRGYRRRRF